MKRWLKKLKKEPTEEKTSLAAVDAAILKALTRESETKRLRVALLGAGGCGKSTILKQMRRLHPEDDAMGRSVIRVDPYEAAESVRRNVVEDIIDISKHCLSMCRGACEVAPSESVLPLLLKWAPLYGDDVELSQEMAAEVVIWWKDACIQLAFDSRKKSHVMDNTPYFFEKVTALAKMDYEVSFEDWVRLRHRSTGVVSEVFQIEGGRYQMEVIDVGGQRSERKKQKVMFSDNVNAVLYVMSLAAYDMWVFEDTTTRCYDETLKLFDDNVNLVHFDSTDFIVFLNKADLFRDKIRTVPFTTYEPSFPSEDARDGDAVIKYLKELLSDSFEAATKSSSKRQLYFHETCAIDDKQIETIIAIIKMQILQGTLRSAGLL